MVVSEGLAKGWTDSDWSSASAGASVGVGDNSVVGATSSPEVVAAADGAAFTSSLVGAGCGVAVDEAAGSATVAAGSAIVAAGSIPISSVPQPLTTTVTSTVTKNTLRLNVSLFISDSLNNAINVTPLILLLIEE